MTFGGIDAISVLGNVANGALLMQAQFGDGVTTLTSGSLGFVAPERTQVIRYCHTDVALLLCSNSLGYIAEINTAEHQSAQIILSFLNDTPAWRNVGEKAEQNSFLSRNGGLVVRLKDLNDRTQSFSRASTSQGDLSIINNQIGYAAQLTVTPLPLQVVFTTGNSTSTALIPLALGTTVATAAKSGPSISAVFPSAAAVFSQSCCPRLPDINLW